MSAFQRFIAVSFLLSFLCLPAILRASCGAISCPLADSSVPADSPGAILLGYSYQYIDQTQAQIGTDRGVAGQIRGHHDELTTTSRIHTFTIKAPLLRWFEVSAAVPFIQRDHQHIHHHRGSDLLESWNISGIGDLAIQTRTSLTFPGQPGTRLSVILGGKFPTGKTDGRGWSQQNNNQLVSAIGEVGIQPGSGSYDFITGIAGDLSFSEVPLKLFSEVLGTFTGKGREDYRLGNSLTAITGFSYSFVPNLAGSFQINGRYARKDERGVTFEEIDKTGGVWIYATPGLKARLSERLEGYFHIQVPVYQNVNVIQLVSPYNVITGITYRFSLY